LIINTVAALSSTQDRQAFQETTRNYSVLTVFLSERISQTSFHPGHSLKAFL
ncbi:hypothetical protein SERLA73DRAFT_192314, partial [Serpula lacrymans var. lacrymans S7.3]